MAVGIFDSISTIKTHNLVLEVNPYNRVACQERFVILKSTFYKPMIEIQMPLYKNDGVVPTSLCNFLVSIPKWYILLIPWTFWGSPDIYAHGLGHIYQAGKSLIAMV